jgi:hypothetical protein
MLSAARYELLIDNWSLTEQRSGSSLGRGDEMRRRGKNAYPRRATLTQRFKERWPLARFLRPLQLPAPPLKIPTNVGVFFTGARARGLRASRGAAIAPLPQPLEGSDAGGPAASSSGVAALARSLLCQAP